MSEIKNNEDAFLEIICVTYLRIDPLRCLVASLACQTNLSFVLKIIHDGPSLDTSECVTDLKRIYPKLNITYQETGERFNDYGHTLRSMGLMDSKQDYVLLTNDDNYYVPVFVDEIQAVINSELPDIVYFDMVHNYAFGYHPNPISYQTLIAEPILNRIDIGSFVFNTKLGQSVGFRGRHHQADGMFFEDMKDSGAKIVKIPKVLFVHN
jgi:hypothetical protein